MLALKNLLFTVIVPGTVAGYLPYYLTEGQRGTGQWTLALPLFGIGLAIYAWCVWDFARYGRGTPAPIDAPKRLVVRGLYRHSRNPMYLGVLMFIAGWVVLTHEVRLLIYLPIVFIIFNCFILFYEEPALERTFGQEYRDYCARVHRWIGRREVN